ncbi:Grx4 family monothiol glutaredoxin [Commensalibacter melissae]|uniref:Grx4 family monothiol glutaredoxin n=1 Tax=Commensalibacter melissae TaxID=2070537 RepID=UPI0012D8622C|nr:Grx4 family monothiol glutaredoxin [Commensalibacter melissae]MUG81168.1 Grx4 family monothiol glutaredoxin [Commensalibacter melissae]
MSNPLFQQIQKEIDNNPVVLFMKGTADFPSCGFSAKVVHILSDMGVSFKDVNILEDDELRQGLKEFSSWPTFPQLYVKGKLVGGCDIVREMYATGELKNLFQDENIISK